MVKKSAINYNSDHKTIFLLRHSDAVNCGYFSDFERNLTETGTQRAIDLGVEVKNIDLDCILCSPAKRTKETLAALNFENVPVLETPSLYLANLDDIKDELINISNSIDKLLLIGQNNGISELASYLVGEYILLSTCQFVEIRLQILDWNHIGCSIGSIKRNILIN